MSKYEIQLGIGLNDADLKSVKQTINNIVNKQHDIDININYNLKNVNKLVEAGREIENIKAQLKELSNSASVGKGKPLVTVDSKSLNADLKKISDKTSDLNKKILKLQNAFGKVDDNKGIQSLLTTVNKIKLAIEDVSKEFSVLNQNLTALSSKNFSMNFDFGFGKSNSKSPEQIYSELRMLKKEAEEYEKYFHKHYSMGNKANADPISRLLMQYKPNNRLYMQQLRNTMTTGEPSSKQVAAYREYINLIKEAAAIGKIALEPVEFRLAESGDFVKVRNEVNETEQKLKELFSGGIDGGKLDAQLDSIVQDLQKIGESIDGLAKNNPIDSLTASFNKLSETLDKLMTNAKLVQDVLGNNLNTYVPDGGAEKAIQEQKELAQSSAQTANVIAQSGQKIQQSYNKISKSSFVIDELDALNLKDDIDEADRLSAALSKLKNIQSNINKIEIGKVNTSKGVQELQLLEQQLESLSAEYNETIAEINSMGGVSATQLQSFQNQIKNTELKLNQLQAEIIDTKTKLAKDIKTNIGTTIARDVNRAHSEFDKLSTKSNNLRKKLDLLDNIKIDLDTAAANNDIDGLIAANEKYKKILKDVNIQLDINKRREKDAAANTKLVDEKTIFKNKINSWLKKNSAAVEKFGDKMLELKAKIESCDKTQLDHLKSEFKQIDMAAEAAGLKTQTFGDRLKTQFKRYSAYLSIYEVFMYTTMALKDMFNEVVAIDTAMTELKKVTDETDASYNSFLDNAGKRAQELGTTIDGLVSSTADFARLGYGFKDAQGLAEIANIYAVVGDDIDSVETATQSLISTLTAFKDEAGNLNNSDFALSIVDKMNEVSNNFAISSGGIGEALQRSASSMMAANNSLDETIALITAANTVVSLCHAA